MSAPGPNLSQFRASALRFGRSLVVGGGGTALDFAAFTLALRVLQLDATWSRVIGLCAGGVLLFFGSRSFAFRAQDDSASVQARRFVVAELIGFPLNVLVFRLLLRALPAVPAELLTLLANFALFVTYYYPVRSLVVFRPRPRPQLAVEVAAARP